MNARQARKLEKKVQKKREEERQTPEDEDTDMELESIFYRIRGAIENEETNIQIHSYDDLTDRMRKRLKVHGYTLTHSGPTNVYTITWKEQ